MDSGRDVRIRTSEEGDLRVCGVLECSCLSQGLATVHGAEFPCPCWSDAVITFLPVFCYGADSAAMALPEHADWAVETASQGWGGSAGRVVTW